MIVKGSLIIFFEDTESIIEEIPPLFELSRTQNPLFGKISPLFGLSRTQNPLFTVF
jgi:hypothetical protein